MASVRTLGGKATVNSQQSGVNPIPQGALMKSMLTVLSIALLWHALSHGQTGERPTSAAPLLVVPETKELHVFGTIYPARFNAAQGDDAHYHLLVWQGGQSTNALIETPADDLAFHDALVTLGAHPGDNLDMAVWNERNHAHHPMSSAKVTGSPLDVRITWNIKPLGVPVSQIFRQSQVPTPQPLVEWRFGGNRDRWFNLVPLAPRPGCLACLYSCPSGKVSNAALSIHEYVEAPSRFVADAAILPPDGTQVIVTFRVLRASP
jgi:hypothetical protein